eukprot:SAG11_NODE_3641_length_2317_cov_1.812444_2_plen_103_part_00
MARQCTLPFEGVRYTLIYWSHSRADMLLHEDRAFLETELGLDFTPPPTPATVGGRERLHTPRVARMAEGVAAFALWERCEGKREDYLAALARGDWRRDFSDM